MRHINHLLNFRTIPSSVILGAVLYFALSVLVACERSQDLNHPISRQNLGRTTGILNGHPAPADSTKTAATVAIGYKDDVLGIKPFCTGTLIAKDLIITDAHCIADDVEYKTTQDVLIYFNNLIENFDASFVRKIAAARLHPNFYVEFNNSKAITTWNDVALIRLNSPAPLNIHPIPVLDGSSNIPEGTALYLLGWGLLSSKPDRETFSLQMTTVKLQGEWKGHWLHDDRPSKTGFCNGDSGGPAFIESHGQIILGGLIRGPHYPYGNCQGFGEITSLGQHQNFILESILDLQSQSPEFVNINPSR